MYLKILDNCHESLNLTYYPLVRQAEKTYIYKSDGMPHEKNTKYDAKIFSNSIVYFVTNLNKEYISIFISIQDLRIDRVKYITSL